MNPHAAYPLSLPSLIKRLWTNRQLILQLTRRDISARYKGSLFGIAWSFLNPLLLLTVYTFVFSVVFKAKWGTSAGEESRSEFALVLFVGMIVHTLFAEVLMRAPRLILENPSYVKKVVFPLEILPAVSSGAALFHTCISAVVLCGAMIVIKGSVPWTGLLLPIVLIPLILLGLGIAWTLASLGVFLRDIVQTMGLLVTVLLFTAPVFYPVAALPKFLQPWLFLNPLTFIIEQSREVLIYGKLPNWAGLAIYSGFAVFIAWLGYAWFQKTRKGFADVI